MVNKTHIVSVGNSVNMYKVFSGQVGGVELVHEVVGVGVLVGVLLGGGRDLRHPATYAKMCVFIFLNRVLFFFYSFAGTTLCKQ